MKTETCTLWSVGTVIFAGLIVAASGLGAAELDEKGRARIVRALVGQGFSFDAVISRITNSSAPSSL